jgi:hypothetical protein
MSPEPLPQHLAVLIDECIKLRERADAAIGQSRAAMAEMRRLRDDAEGHPERALSRVAGKPAGSGKGSGKGRDG